MGSVGDSSRYGIRRPTDLRHHAIGRRGTSAGQSASRSYPGAVGRQSNIRSSRAAPPTQSAHSGRRGLRTSSVEQRSCPSRNLGSRRIRRRRRLNPESRHQHGDTAPVLGVPLAVDLAEIPLLEPDRDEDVSRGRYGEEEVRRGHRRRCPEGEEPADVEGMPHGSVRTRSDEAERPVWFPRAGEDTPVGTRRGRSG
jgi:hypothetical protein